MLSKIFTSVSVNKLFLTTLSFIAVFVLCLSVDRWNENRSVILVYFAATAINSFIPDYLYRGIEKMTAITVRTVVIKLFFTLMVFVFVKKPEDILLIPILQAVGNLGALLASLFDLRRRLNIGFCRITLHDMFYRLKRSATFFLSRIATTAYTSANTVVLDLISGGTVTGYYTSADKLMTTAKNGISPISDSIYPYMIKHRDFSIIKKMLLLLEPVIIAACAVMFIWAEPVCVWFFGEGFEGTAVALRALLPIGVIVLPSYLLGFPALGAMGLVKHANLSVVYASIFHIVTLAVLFFAGLLNIVTLGIATSCTEGLILLYRVVIILKNKHLLKSGK
jgi:PST family polysaccharide transporter